METPNSASPAQESLIPERSPAAVVAGERVARQERLRTKLNEPDLLETVCDHVANGGSLIELCRIWDVSYNKVVFWIYDAAYPARKKDYELALVACGEWMEKRILDELKSIGLVDIRGAFDKEGALLPPEEWPLEISRVVAGVDVFEEFDGRGDERKSIGFTRKLKLHDKLRALELMGKHRSMFKERVELEHHGKFSLEEMVKGSMAALTPPAPTLPAPAAPSSGEI